MFQAKLNKKYFRLAEAKVNPGFMPTRQGLAYSPSKMLELAERGIPISSPNVGTFFDGVDRPEWSVPIERQRGVDPADVWQAQADARYKFHTAKIEKVQISKDE